MKKPVSLWMFGIGGIITDILGGGLLFLMLYMPVGAYFMVQLLVVTCLLILLLVMSTVALFKLKKWGKNIFVVLTLILNIVLIWGLLHFSLMSIFVIIFIFCFMVYFLKPEVRKLFDS
ncbi:MAG: hypothetical protein WCY09_06885 [Candidatus Omnitrophota bacterium]